MNESLKTVVKNVELFTNQLYEVRMQLIHISEAYLQLQREYKVVTDELFTNKKERREGEVWKRYALALYVNGNKFIPNKEIAAKIADKVLFGKPFEWYAEACEAIESTPIGESRIEQAHERLGKDDRAQEVREEERKTDAPTSADGTSNDGSPVATGHHPVSEQGSG